MEIPLSDGHRARKVQESGMGKVITLGILLVVALLSGSGFIYINSMINSGELDMIAGKKALAAGKVDMKAGKARLSAGKTQLSEGKAAYAKARKNWLLVFADKAFNKGQGFKDAQRQIAEGEQQVAAGQSKVDAGQARLDQGRQDLIQGRNLLTLAKGIRIALGGVAIVLLALAAVLTFFWRHSLMRTFERFRHKKA
ncbi:MAG: hypothetical protein WCB49_05925 [Gammaproteobacteria bacterium]